MPDAQSANTEPQSAQELAARDATIANLREQIGEREKERDEARQSVTQLTSQLGALQKQVSEQAAQIAAYEAKAREAARPASLAAPPPAPAGTPQEIVLTQPYGFIDEHGANRSWPAGMKIQNPQDIALLITRGAAHVVALPAATQAPATAKS